MNLLNTIYENKINFPLFLERTIKITNNFSIITGSKSVGKTYLIYDYLSQLQEDSYLYIDLLDLKLESNEIINLQEFIKQHSITTLVIENYDYSFKLPKVDSIILSINSIQENDLFTKYSYIYLNALTFEEYLLFDNKRLNITTSFNSFLKYGNFPESINYKDFDKTKRNQELLMLYTNNTTDLEILKILILSTSEIKSPFWLYTILKSKIKISKDYLYKSIKQFQNSGTIIMCEKYLNKKATKKIFIYNHALVSSVSYNKKFSNIFSTMVFLELLHHHHKIFYLDNIDFYVPSKQKIILAMPFYNQHILSNMTKNILNSIKDLSILSITIVTISNNNSLYIDDIPCDIVPFYEWALSD